MLSINPVTSVGHAQSYFMGGENYYMGESNGRSTWWGKGAQALGLLNEVQKNSFVDLLNGKLPNGEILGKMVEGKIQHRPGFDLTFSIPKSASIIALRSNDPAVYESIVSSTRKAVEKTLGLIEHSCASARVTVNGKTDFINTKNLVAALHLHELSREDEAGIHVHAVVMNMTQRSDGKWRSLASKSGYYGKNATGEINGFFERIGNQKKQLGAIFRAELAYELKQKGFPIVTTDKKQGFFEIEGISTALLEAHSSRAIQKEAYMSERGFEGGNAAAVATQVTRKTKSKRSPDVIKKEWLEKENLKGVDAEREVIQVLKQVAGKGLQIVIALSPDEPLVKERAAVEYALEILSESEIKIKSIQLINSALSHSLEKDLSIKRIVKAIDELKQEGLLVPIAQSNGDMYYTTKTQLDYEKVLIKATASILPVPVKINPDLRKDTALKKELLTSNQKQAINEIFQSEYQITALEGRSHTGKTTMIKPLVQIAKKSGYAPVVLTPSQIGSNNIKDEIQKAPNKLRQFLNTLLDSNEYLSVSGFLYQKAKQIETDTLARKPMMIFVDNAQTLSLKQMHDLVALTGTLNARLVPIFDTKGTFSFQPGNPLQQMFEHGMKTVVLKDVIKGSSKKILNASVQDTLENNIVGAFQKIENRIFSIENKEQRNLTIASMYARMSFDERKKTDVIMLSKSQCEEVNLAIHKELLREQHISSEGKAVSTLIPKSLKSAEYRLAKNYDPGQWVRFNETYESINVTRGEYLKIAKVNSKLNVVILEKPDSKLVQWNPQKLGNSSLKIEVFDEKEREICPGDTLIWKRNNRENSIASGEKLKVLHTSTHKITFERENNKKVSVDIRTNENRHFDYGYAITPHQSLNKKSEAIIAYQNAFSRQSHQRQFYKILSQAKNEVWIFTESKDDLLKNIQRNTGNKSSVIDVVLNIDKPQLPITQHEYINRLETMIEKVISRLASHDNLLDKSPESISKEAVKYALSHLTEREAAFQHKDVMDVALKHILGDANSDHIRDAVVQAEKEGILIRGVYSRDGTRWTTQEAVHIEREIISLAKKDKGYLPEIIPDSKVQAYLSTQPSLKKDHVIAITEWMKTPDRVVMVQGDAGTGKTTMLERAKPLLDSEKLLSDEGYSLLCLAPTHIVVDELQSRGLTAQTLDSFLAEQSHAKTIGSLKKFNDSLIIAVDENSMVSNRRERDFLRVVNDIDARAVLIGDQRQYSSIESGKPHTLLQSDLVGLKVIRLNEIVRQKNPELMKPVEHTYYKEFDKAFDLLKNNIIEIGKAEVTHPKIKTKSLQGLDNPSLRLEKMAEDFLSLSLEERSTTGILTLSNAHRIELNKNIRDGLKLEGELTGTAETLSVLVSTDMTKVERSKTANFEARDIIRFGMGDPQLPVKKGEYLRISEIHQKENLVTLCKANNEKIIWRPQSFDKDAFSGIEIYREEKRELMTGDLIRWTRSNKSLGLLSPKIVRIESIEKGIASLRSVKMTESKFVPDGESFKIDLTNPNYQHWDHAHVMTSYGAQSKGFRNVMANMDSYSRTLTNQAAFLIVLTRSIENFTLYTDDKKALLEKIQITPGTKTSALEVTGELNLTENRKRTSKNKSIGSEAMSLDSKVKIPVHDFKKSPVLDANRIIPELHERAESIVIKLLGEPKSKSAANYIYSYSEQFGGDDGKREGGSLSIAVSGEKKGLWKCFKTGESGNFISLIQKKFNLSFKESLEYAAQLLGLQSHELMVSKPQIHLPKKEGIPLDKSDPKNWSKNDKYMVKVANQLARESLPLNGTLAEKYLREHRSIDLKDMPASLRFHPAVRGGKGLPSYPALLAIGRNEKGQVQRIQAIYLDSETAGKANLNVNKRTYALAPGSSVNLSRNVKNKQVSYLAEGVETGLSILSSIDNGNVEAVLGVSNFKHPSLKNLSKDVVFCLDNDGVNSASEKAIHEAAKVLGQQGKTIWIAMPTEVGSDFNDILKSQGPAAVRRTIDQAILYSEWASKIALPTTVLKNELEQRKLHGLPHSDNKLLIKSLTGKDVSNAYLVKLMNETEAKPSLDNDINKLAYQLNREYQTADKAHIDLYKSFNPTRPKDIERAAEVTKDIEREI